MRRVSALRGGRLAPLGLDGGERHELYPPVVVRGRGSEHSEAAVVGWTSEHFFFPPPPVTTVSPATSHWISASKWTTTCKVLQASPCRMKPCLRVRFLRSR